MGNQNKRHRKVRKCISGPNFSGQHYLHNPATIADLIRSVSPQATDWVLDIGAGKGALTFPLAETAGKVIAVENDPRCAELLRRKAGSDSRITVVEQDFRFMKLPHRPFYVAANIPFSITTDILEKLLGPEGALLLGGALLIEVGAARRLTAAATADPRLLSWRTNFELTVQKVVPRAHFAPPPRVDGAILRIVRRKQPLLKPGQYRLFRAFAACLLGEPRLACAEALKGIFTAPQIKAALRQAAADRHQSVLTLKERQWAVLFQAMLDHVPSYRWPKP